MIEKVKLWFNEMPKYLSVPCLITAIHWVLSLLVYFLSNNQTLKLLQNIIIYLAPITIVLIPIFAFIAPVLIFALLIAYGYKHKKVNPIPIIVILFNIAHSFLIYQLIADWF